MSYTLSSDQHAHNWSQFSKPLPSGVNSRLQAILDELKMQAQVSLAQGITKMRLAGDLFHVRGKVEPEVFNPTYDTFREITGMGMIVDCLAGNHDLSGKVATAIGNAMQKLDEIPGFNVIIEPTDLGDVVMIPWVEDLAELRAIMSHFVDPNKDLIIHAPVNGVIKGIPNHGLEASELELLGYRRVFSGHYHNHKQLRPTVWSIGATTHQTWNDPGTVAGYMIVDDQDVVHMESGAPKFCNFDDADLKASSPYSDFADCYVRMRLTDCDEDVIKRVRDDLIAAGALGVVDHSARKHKVTRQNAATGKSLTIRESVVNFVKNDMSPTYSHLDPDLIAKEALSVLEEASNAGASA